LACLAGDYHREMGEYFQDDTHYLRATHFYRIATGLDSNFFSAWFGMARVKYAQALQKESFDGLKKALYFFEKAESCLEGHHPAFYLHFVKALVECGNQLGCQKTLRVAMEKCKKMQGVLPLHSKYMPKFHVQNGCAHLFFGQIADDEESYEHAYSFFKKALNLHSDDKYLSYFLGLSCTILAGAMHDKALFEDGVCYFEKHIQEQPEDDRAHLDFALSLIEFGRQVGDFICKGDEERFFQSAERLLFAAARLGNEYAHYHLAGLYALLGRYSDAVHYLREADRKAFLPEKDELLKDEWLSSLHDLEEFKLFLTERRGGDCESF